jgi:hypothetical protein
MPPSVRNSGLPLGLAREERRDLVLLPRVDLRGERGCIGVATVGLFHALGSVWSCRSSRRAAVCGPDRARVELREQPRHVPAALAREDIAQDLFAGRAEVFAR